MPMKQRECDEMLLRADNLDVHYGAIHALSGVTVEIDRGEIVTLIGANGAGKSTTLRAICGMVRPSGGRVQLDGQDITGTPSHALVARGLSHVPEGRGIFANLTVAENLDLGGYARTDRSALAADRERALKLFPRLRERLTQLAGTLSGGEQQMLAIGRALMARPKLLLLDEPSLGLAPLIVRKIFQIIRDINAEGTTIFLVEQNAHMALGVAHRAYVLQTGRVIKSGDAKGLLEDEDVKKAYLGG
jgi:branched-chain amino acid transport system ATP-binding protein